MVEEHDRCCICNAYRYLTQEDWRAIGFYRQAHSQYRNQTPMGTGDKDRPILQTPVLSDWKAILEIYDYPREDWADLTDTALFLFYVIDQNNRTIYDSDGQPISIAQLTDEDVIQIPLVEFLESRLNTEVRDDTEDEE